MPDKVVIVTGASRGLGEEIVRQLITRECSVVMFARDAWRLQSLADNMWRAVAISGDVTAQEDCERLIEETVARFDKIDALVNCAGVIHPIETIARARADAWARVYDVNVLGALRISSLALPHLFRQNGKIINVSSIAVQRRKPGFAAYSASKAALNHLTEMLALENEQVLSIAVCPGAMDTDMQRTIAQDTRDRDDIVGRFFQGRPARTLPSPEKPARAIAALAMYAGFGLQGQVLMWDDERVQELLRTYWTDL